MFAKNQISVMCPFLVLFLSLGFGFLGCSAKHRSSGRYAYQSKSNASPSRHSRQRQNGYAQTRREAPGLGTAYGRSVYAPIRFVPFVRSGRRPSRMLRLYYNDPAGIRAMVKQLRGYSRCRPIALHARGGVSMWLHHPSRGRPYRGARIGGRTMVMGQHGRHYAISLRNHTSLRFEAIISVDGLDVNDGQRANLHKRGYILHPHQTLTIRGFRRSRNQVAAFRFSTVKRSYAARTGQGGNLGVIGVALFSEQKKTWTRSALNRRWNAQPFVEPVYAHP